MVPAPTVCPDCGHSGTATAVSIHRLHNHGYDPIDTAYQAYLDWKNAKPAKASRPAKTKTASRRAPAR